jgi:hypothetical protein
LIGSSKENFKLLDVLPYESIYKKNIIVFIIKNFESYLDMKKVIDKRGNRAFDVRMEYSKKAFGHKCIDYLVPKNYNLMSVNLKREIFYIERNHITTGVKKKLI